mgnify:CR=1 FL=1
MEDHPSRIELIKLLIGDRNLHFNHPLEVALIFLYSIGGTLTTVLVALLIKNGKLEGLVKLLLSDTNLPYLILSGVIIGIGYIFIFWGLSEHTQLHANQRKRIEEAIEYLVKTKPD